jgi:hypothetical protein
VDTAERPDPYLQGASDQRPFQGSHPERELESMSGEVYLTSRERLIQAAVAFLEWTEGTPEHPPFNGAAILAELAGAVEEFVKQ